MPYRLTANGADVYTVTDPKAANGSPKTYEVDLRNKTCCDYMFDMQQPCRHCVVVFHKYGHLSTDNVDGTLEKFWPYWAHADKYRHAYEGKTIKIPRVHTGPFAGASDPNSNTNTNTNTNPQSTSQAMMPT